MNALEARTFRLGEQGVKRAANPEILRVMGAISAPIDEIEWTHLSAPNRPACESAHRLAGLPKCFFSD